jgi:hypothetical protein
MPVLDAQALNQDPKGAAFLLGVLRSDSSSKASVSPVPRHKASKRSEERASLVQQRLALLQSHLDHY